MTDDWTASVLDSEGAIRMGRAICVATGVGAAVTGAILLANLIHGKIDGLGLLLGLAIPILVAGQLWAIAILVARQKRVDRGESDQWWFRKTRASRLYPFEGLPRWLASAFIVVFVLCWLTAVVALLHLISGGPASSTPRCRYRLVNHGEYSCVSRSTYFAARNAEPRLVAGVLTGFFVIQFGVAAAELTRRRVEASGALGLT